LERKRARTEALAGKLGTLSPKATLHRGYAIVRTDVGVVASRTAVSPGMHVDVELAEGGFGALVEDVHD
jgi:exodeoxyribonuclease VII large subunit